MKTLALKDHRAVHVHRSGSPGLGRPVKADPPRQCPCGRVHQRQGAGLLCGDCEIAAMVARRRR